MSQSNSDGAKTGKTGNVEVLVFDPLESNAADVFF